MIDENEVVAEHTENKMKSDRSKIPVSMIHLFIFLLQRGKVLGLIQSTSSLIMCHENLSPQFITFTASLNSITIPKSIHLALECPEWKVEP